MKSAPFTGIMKSILRKGEFMKLNYKSTVLVGFAFFSITLFWQVYDSMIPKVLENIFNFNNTERGLVMAADNVVALFMLPLFGHLSDKTKTRWGNIMKSEAKRS